MDPAKRFISSVVCWWEWACSTAGVPTGEKLHALCNILWWAGCIVPKTFRNSRCELWAAEGRVAVWDSYASVFYMAQCKGEGTNCPPWCPTSLIHAHLPLKPVSAQHWVCSRGRLCAHSYCCVAFHPLRRVPVHEWWTNSSLRWMA